MGEGIRRLAAAELELVRAGALGATVIVPRQDLPDGDRMAVIAAPGGSTWGLVQRR